MLSAAASSSDTKYNGLNPAAVSVTNNHKEVAGFTVTPTAGVSIPEAAGTAIQTFNLTSQPSANVTIGMSSSNTAEGTVAPASLTFTAGNWNTAQTVTVTGVDDFGVDGAVAYTVVTAAATSTDGGYNGMNPEDGRATSTDDEEAWRRVATHSGRRRQEGR